MRPDSKPAVDDAQLDDLRRVGRIQDDTLVWREGMANWQPYSQVKSPAASPVAPLSVQAGPGAETTREAVCAECGRIFNMEDMIRHGGNYVCANCKPVFMQKLAEGAKLADGSLNYAGYLETSSPFGFWSVRKAVPANSEIRVYPNLFTERRNLAALFLHRGAFGLHAQRQLGKGREFEKLREYVPGDGYDEIHWKATARRGRPITKVFQIERTQEVYVVIDASRLSARQVVSGVRCQVSGGNTTTVDQPDTSHLRLGTSTLERFVTAALMVGLVAEQQGDLFGLLTFTNKVETFVRAKNGKAHYSACRDALYTLQPQIVSPDFDELCTFIRLRRRRRALLIFLTSLDDPVVADSFVKNMDLIRRQHFVLVNMLQPPGVAEVFTNPNLASVDELYQHLGGHLLWHNLRELEKVLQRRGVRFSLLKNEKLSAELVSQYLSVKRRQLL